MRTSAPTVALLLAALASGEARAQHAAAAPLRMHYVAGQRARYATRTVQTMPGAAAPSTSTSSVEVETVRVNADGSAEQRMRITRMDVSGVPEALRGRLSTGLAGVSLEYTQDARGHVTARREPAGVSPELRPVVDGVMESLEQMGAALPEQPVAVGSTWSDHRTLHLPLGPAGTLDLAVEVTYTLRQLRGVGPAQTAVLGVATTLATPPGASVGGLQVTGSGSSSGESALNLGVGLMGRSRSTGSMRIQLNVRGRPVDVQSRFENEMTPEAARPAAPLQTAPRRR